MKSETPDESQAGGKFRPLKTDTSHVWGETKMKTLQGRQVDLSRLRCSLGRFVAKGLLPSLIVRSTCSESTCLYAVYMCGTHIINTNPAVRCLCFIPQSVFFTKYIVHSMCFILTEINSSIHVWCKVKTVLDCRLQTRGQMQTEGKLTIYKSFKSTFTSLMQLSMNML